MGIACYAGLILFTQGGDSWSAMLAFPLSYLPLLFALAFLNYLLRYVRWHVYLKALGIPLGYWKSFQISMAGLAMTITPGKAGEAMKAHLLRRDVDNPWSVGLPAVFAERLTDLMGIVILVALGLGLLPEGKKVALLGLAICVLLFLIFSQSTLFKGLIRLLGKVPRMAERSKKLLDMHQNIRQLLSFRLLLVSILLSVAAWFAECLVLFFALIACKGDAVLIQATFIYALSTLAGALCLLPGGLVATEGSMTGLLHLFGVGLSQGTTVTLVVRFCTLWFAVFIGMIFLFFLQWRREPELQPVPD
jgi:uncharacterized protein (TIRG00374 family)